MKAIEKLIYQNHSQFNKICKQEDMIPMPKPTSGILSEILIQNLEHRYFEKIK